MARPRKPRQLVRSEILMVRLTKSELAALKKKAKAAGIDVAELIRRYAVEAREGKTE